MIINTSSTDHQLQPHTSTVGQTHARIPELDALRGAAAVLVLLHHGLVIAGPWSSGTPLLDRAVHTLLHFSPLHVMRDGRAPVLLFFVLSGYVLTRALLRGGSPGLPAFAAQRTVRLVLPVAAATLFSAGLYWSVADPALLQGTLREHSLGIWTGEPTLAGMLRETLLLSTDRQPAISLNNVLWSLVIEWRLTVLLPLILLFRGRVWLLLALACLAMQVGILGGARQDQVHLGPQMHSTVAATLYFVPGIAAGAALAMLGPLPALTRDQRLAAGVAALALLGTTSDLALYVASVLLILLAQQPAGGLPRVLRGRVLVWLGKISFSLYLVHAPVLVAWVTSVHGALPLWAGILTGLAVALLAAAVMHRLVEAPSRRLARWVELRLTRRRRLVVREERLNPS